MNLLRTKLILLLMVTMQVHGISQEVKKTYPPEPQPKRPANFKPYRYKYTIQQLQERFSDTVMRRAAIEVKNIQDVNAKGEFKPTFESLKSHKMPEWFEDAKLGIFLDWGPWSSAGYAPKKGAEASTGGSYPDWYEFLMDYRYKAYHDSTFGTDFRRDDLLPLLTGKNFNAREYMDLAVQTGAKYFVPFAKHHAGWTMWESFYTKRNAVEMGPGRDVYKEINEAAREKNMKMGFYFSVSEWEYPVIVDRRQSQWDPIPNLAVFQDELGQIARAKPLASYFPEVMDRMASGKIPVKNYFSDYMMPSFKEVVDKFDPDLIWYDGGWGSPVSVSRVGELSAYFYNKAAGRKDVVINNRAGSTLSDADMKRVSDLMKSGDAKKAMEIYTTAPQLGDYGTPEYSFGEAKTTQKWEVCRSISPAFGYNWQDDDASSLSSKELIKLFIKIVSENGNLLLVISPDGSGRLPDIQKDRMLDLGKYLKVNGEAIYGTRPWERTHDGENMYFTRSKDGRYLYVHCTEWSGSALKINGVTPAKGSKVTMLGSSAPLKWENVDGGMRVVSTSNLDAIRNRTSDHAVVFKVQLK